MRRARRKLGFVLAASSHGPLIVDRFDYNRDGNRLFGVGGEILEWSAFDPEEIDLLLGALHRRREYFGDGVVLIDCGANIGVHTIEWAKAMASWGSVLSIEAQERIYYALAGNIAINNCFNAIAVHGAVSNESGVMQIPNPNYFVPSSFGSLELRQRNGTEFIGQPIDYQNTVNVRRLMLDEFGLPRVDLIKIDVEGMEIEVLAGAAGSLARAHPILIVEMIKSDKAKLGETLRAYGYRLFEMGLNLLAVHESDQTLTHVKPT